jgi:hypothetical protein
MIPQEPYQVPFVVLVDSAESQPFTFQGIPADADKLFRPLVIPTRFQCLGRYPNSQGDYSIAGLEHAVGIERKSLEDIQGTVLGWPSDYDQKNQLASRQDRFKKELENLTKLAVGAVVIEATEDDVIAAMPSHGVKSVAENQKLFNRIVIGLQIDYRVPWFWCSSRRHAECKTYRILARSWRKLGKETRHGKEAEGDRRP